MSNRCALAIEAATRRFSLAACYAGRTVSWQAEPARDETQRIYQHAEKLLGELGASYAMLEFVAFGCGPGSFTGARIAAAAAQAIAFARSIPVCRISTLAVLAAGAQRAMRVGLAGVCLDARSRRAYIALYRVTAESVVPVYPDALIDPGEFVIPGTEQFAAIGDGWSAYPDLLRRHASRTNAIDTALLPSSEDLLRMAIMEFEAGLTVGACEALPEYLGQGFGSSPRPSSGEN